MQWINKKPEAAASTNDVVGRRIERERERRGWSHAALAERMSAAGCSMRAATIVRIERADDPRPITVNELSAFAAVFGVTPAALLSHASSPSPDE
jgi:transcriptional regulator with XRE-family HTH domain